MIRSLALAAALAPIERALNHVLHLDPVSLDRLADLAGRVIAIDCEQPNLQLFVWLHAQGVSLSSRHSGAVDCRLVAPAEVLLALALAQNKRQSLQHSAPLRIEGDRNTLLALCDLLDAMELDWGYQLSLWLGPLAGGLIARALARQGEWLKHSLARLYRDTADYLSEEAHSLVGRNEAAAHFAQLDELRQRTADLEARLQRLAPRRLSA